MQQHFVNAPVGAGWSPEQINNLEQINTYPGTTCVSFRKDSAPSLAGIFYFTHIKTCAVCVCIFYSCRLRRNKQRIVRCKSGDLQLTRFAVSPSSQKGALRYHLFGSPALNSSPKNKKTHTPPLTEYFLRTSRRTRSHKIKYTHPRL